MSGEPMAPNGWPAALDSLADTTLTHPGILKVASGLEIRFPHDCNKWPGFYVAGKHKQVVKQSSGPCGGLSLPTPIQSFKSSDSGH